MIGISVICNDLQNTHMCSTFLDKLFVLFCSELSCGGGYVIRPVYQFQVRYFLNAWIYFFKKYHFNYLPICIISVLLFKH